MLSKSPVSATMRLCSFNWESRLLMANTSTMKPARRQAFGKLTSDSGLPVAAHTLNLRPLMTDAPTSTLIEPPQGSPRARVLTVDDQKETLGVIKVRVEDAGMECLTAMNGPDALEILRTEAVDLIILDVMMP